MVCDHTIYVLCTQVSNDCTDISNLSVTNSLANLTPENKGKIIGIMVTSSNTCVFCQSLHVKVMEDTL